MEKKIWTFLSYLFHPALMPTLGVFIVLWCDPKLFILINAEKPWLIVLALIFLCTYVLPILFGGILKLIGAVSSLSNPSENDRKILLSSTALLFIIGYYLFHNIPDSGESLKIFMLGINISIIITLITSLFTQVSFHSVGAGGVLGTVIGLMKYTQGNLIYWLAGAFVLVILTSLARYRLKAHPAFDIYVGLIIGITTQALVFFLPTHTI